MSLRARLLVAGGTCLVVVVLAFIGVADRQQRVMLDQLDTRLQFIADRAAERGPGSPIPGPDQLGESGVLFVGVVLDDTLIVLAEPASAEGLAPDLADLLAAPIGVPVTVDTADGQDMRVVVQDLGGPKVVLGESTAAIDEAIRSLRLSGLVSLAAIGGFGVLVAAWVNRLGIEPLRVATEVARAITDGRRDERMPETSATTEAVTLGRAMNLMLDANAATEARLRSFVADASHELRTPLTTLIGYADLHRSGALTNDEAVADAMRRIRGEAKRMSAIVEHLLLLANIDDDAITLEPKTVDVHQLLDDVAADARAVQPARHIRTEVDDHVDVVADPERLLQAVSSLVTNALLHTPVSASLTLAADATEGTMAIRVVDNGPGIAEEHLEHLFDRFYRVDEGRDRASGGSGLGLAIARSIAEAHGGAINVESTLGEGSAFVVTLPRSGPDRSPGNRQSS